MGLENPHWDLRKYPYPVDSLTVDQAGCTTPETHVKQGFITDSRVQEISYGPSKIARVYLGHIVNGYLFHTRDYGRNKSMMNNGVCVKGSAYNVNEVDYYGILEEVIELQFFGTRQQCISLQVSLVRSDLYS
ncbi:hypothetical protein Taro_020003 [Colocasia esculenta]|uniref:Uncharacterized protein n=1 Tax=Colocasia esculenta TaxID=4460 RepID=A0A843V115_COLES|nr:hypothetical protein [Colocasia esculenta]